MNQRARVLMVTALAVSTPMIEGAGVSAARTRHDAANPFTSRLREHLEGRSGNITAAAYDINTRRTYLYRPGVREETASIVKADILATLLHEKQHHGGLSSAEIGIAQGMIEASDNGDATALWNEEGGGPAVAAFDARVGMTETTPNLAWGLTTTTPRDQLKLLRLIMLPNRVLLTSSRVFEYELMRNVISSERWGVSGGVPFGAVVALKNGWLPFGAGWHVNSIGRITGFGRRYLLAVMTDSDPTEGYGIDTIEHISAAVWHALKLQTLDRFIPPKHPRPRPRGGR
ncbi:MAG TPA: serine hydrolase [Solirubrobacteraceae bacterium]|nr:serine hydrolase [Solirubrobacteraceae bacterium]